MAPNLRKSTRIIRYDGASEAASIKRKRSNSSQENTTDGTRRRKLSLKKSHVEKDIEDSHTGSFGATGTTDGDSSIISQQEPIIFSNDSTTLQNLFTIASMEVNDTKQPSNSHTTTNEQSYSSFNSISDHADRSHVQALPPCTPLAVFRDLPNLLSPTLPPSLQPENSSEGNLFYIDNEISEVESEIEESCGTVRAVKSATSLPLSIDLSLRPPLSTGFSFTKEAYEKYSIFSAERAFKRRKTDMIITQSPPLSSTTTIQHIQQPNTAVQHTSTIKNNVDMLSDLLDNILPGNNTDKKALPSLNMTDGNLPTHTPLDIITAWEAVKNEKLVYSQSSSLVSPKEHQFHQQLYSSLKREEHLRFLQLEELLRTNPSLVGEADRVTYRMLLDTVVEERKQFLQWQFNKFKASEKWLILQSSISAQVEELYEKPKKRLLEQYPRFYEFHHAIGVLISAPNAKEEPVLSRKTILSQRGVWCQLEVPKITEPIPVSLAKEYWIRNSTECQLNVTNGGSQIPETGNCWQKRMLPPVSQDPEIFGMAARNRVHIVISSSGLAAFVELQASIDTEWEIPILVMEWENEGKTVFIDKPLIKKKMSPREKNQKFYDEAFKSMCLSLANKTQLTTATDDKQNHKSTLLERYGSNIPSPIHISSAPDETKPVDLASLTSLHDETTSSASPSICKMPVDLDGQNLTYTLWSFGDLNVLVRYKSDSFLEDNNQDGQTQLRSIGIKTKLEYQLEDGWWEEMTPIERARLWIYSHIRMHGHLILGRVDVLKNTVVRVERKQMSDIFEGDKWSPLPYSKMLRHLFSKLLMLTPGQYLLSHTKGSGNAEVFRSIEVTSAPSTISASQKSSYDLHEAHKGLVALDVDTVPYITAWGGPKEQVKFTFPWRKFNEASTNFLRSGYCFTFANAGSCQRSECPYQHLTPEAISAAKIQEARASFRKAGKTKKKKKKATVANEESEQYLDRAEDRSTYDWDANHPTIGVANDFDSLLSRHITDGFS